MHDGFGLNFAKILMAIGIIFLCAGAIWYFGGKIFNLGNLPGDINIKREGFSLHFPIVTSIIISIILTVLLNIFFRK